MRRGLLEKADELYKCDDPRFAHKPLAGPLQRFYRITYSRYRAIYSVEEQLADKNVIVRIKVQFVAAGIRKERDKNDVYRVAQKLVELGLIGTSESSESQEDADN